jgi:hypothetical protein
MNMDKIENLLQQVSIIQKKYDEIAKITGENFNIFSIMRAETDEVRTHSRIIAELLNPKGLHSLGSIFLKLFFEEVKDLNDILENFDYDNAQVVVEEHTGRIDEDYSEGGFIDIILKDSKNQVVIENKINAGDQKGQLLRYKNKYPNCKLLYLTLDGKKPNESSYIIEKGLELKLEDIILVSYRDIIKNWLEKCLEKTYSLPVIRETLVQYLYLIKKLTNQTTNIKMENEILDNILNNPQNIESALIIAGVGLDNIKLGICKRLISKIQKKVGNNLITKDYDATVSFGKLESGMWFSSQEEFKIGVLLWFDANYNLNLGIDVNCHTHDEKQAIRKICGSDTNWITATDDFNENFNNLKWEEILLENNISEIVIKIMKLIETVKILEEKI